MLHNLAKPYFSYLQNGNDTQTYVQISGDSQDVWVSGESQANWEVDHLRLLDNFSKAFIMVAGTQ